MGIAIGRITCARAISMIIITLNDVALYRIVLLLLIINTLHSNALMILILLYVIFFINMNDSKGMIKRNAKIVARKDVGAECRHNMRPSVQMPSVSGVDSKLSHRTTVRPSLQLVPEQPGASSGRNRQVNRCAGYAAISRSFRSFSCLF